MNRHHPAKKWCAALAALLTAAQLVSAQEPVAAGKGSYASVPPAGQGGIDNSNLNLLQAQDRAIPTNHYWTNLLFKGNTGLWSYPLRVATDKNGLGIYFPTRFNSEGKSPGDGPVAEFPLTVATEGGGNPLVKDWSDWLLSFRMGSADKYMDVTLGQGMPYTWIEVSRHATIGA